MTTPITTSVGVKLVADWTEARRELAELERAEHPDITDRYGRVWTWLAGELYRHDETLAFPKAMIDGARLPSPDLANNPNYSKLCATCRSEWPVEA